ncbi:uncharacterized protein PITG_03797 [Phytophthora infestans T30-4]|uniref:Uncharacterized protein n=1 Tax=Phytophthora infestans (strain T30-4) TaxID=403677 RepID=D0MYJ4_PHYIT|nr:uncharacterized protein PITG_03797 [Phytophthora infestans T30-4]EEY66242.1 conserved hypothetical protein [Phytophthora infestans T30-4]|eukprot:XP_002906841.1 conserved hypothetical protein [Phytophthora infestans T30-4]
MHKVESSKIPEAADRLFVRLADGLCPRDEGESDHKDSDWKRDLRFIVPVGACVFVLGCAGLVYLLRRHKKESAKKNETAETPKEEDKQDPSSLPYVLSAHPV